MPENVALLQELVRSASGRLGDLRLSTGPAGGGYLPLAGLAGPSRGMLDGWIANTATLAEGMDGKTCAAYLVGSLAWTIGRGLGALQLLGGPLPAIPPHALAVRQEVRLAADGTTAAIYYHLRLLDGVPLVPSGPLHTTLEGLHAPLVEALHARLRLARRAQWLLVADGIAAGFLDSGKRLVRAEEAMAAAAAVLRQRRSPLRSERTSFVEIRTGGPEHPEGTKACEWFRLRAGCCRYYTTVGGEFCTTCVLRDPADRVTRLTEFLRRKIAAAV